MRASLELNWPAVPGASHYQLRHKLSALPNWPDWSSDFLTKPQAVIDELLAGRQYEVEVRACMAAAAADCAPSNQILTATVPDAPAGLTVVNLHRKDDKAQEDQPTKSPLLREENPSEMLNGLMLLWQPLSGNEDAIQQVGYSLDLSRAAPDAGFELLSRRTSSCRFEELSSARPYRVFVRTLVPAEDCVVGDTKANSCRLLSASDWQSAVTVSDQPSIQKRSPVESEPEVPQVLPPLPLPEVPQIQSLKAGDGQITVSWEALPPGREVIHYELDIAIKGRGWQSGPKPIQGIRESEVEVTDLENGTEYAFRVRAMTVAGLSAWSATAYGMSQAPWLNPDSASAPSPVKQAAPSELLPPPPSTPQPEEATLDASPQLESISAQVLQLSQGTVGVTLSATGAAEDQLSYQVATSNPAVVSVAPQSLTAFGADSQLNLTPNQAGTAVIIVTLSDGVQQNVLTFTAQVEAEEVNREPQISPLEDVSHAVGAEHRMKVTATDADGDDLQYRVHSQHSQIATVMPTEFQPLTEAAVLTVQSRAAGSSEISVVVSDGRSEQIETFMLEAVSATVVLDDFTTGVKTLHGQALNLEVLPSGNRTPSGLRLEFSSALLGVDALNSVRVNLQPAKVPTAPPGYRISHAQEVSLTGRVAEEAVTVCLPRPSASEEIYRRESGAWHPLAVDAGKGSVCDTMSEHALFATMVQNQRPEITAIENQSVLAGTQLWVAVTGQDPDGDDLQYRAYSRNLQTATVTPTAFEPLTETAGLTIQSLTEGTAEITVVVSDGLSEQSETFTVEAAPTTVVLENVSTGMVDIHGRGLNLEVLPQGSRTPAGFTLEFSSDLVGIDGLTAVRVNLQPANVSVAPLGYRTVSATELELVGKVAEEAVKICLPQKSASEEVYRQENQNWRLIAGDARNGSVCDTVSESSRFVTLSQIQGPQITAIEDQSVSLGTELTVALNVQDFDGKNLQYQASSSAAQIAAVSPQGMTAYTASSTVNIRPLAVGEAVITVMVSDAHAQSVATFTVTVAPVVPVQRSNFLREVESSHALTLIDNVNQAIMQRIESAGSATELRLGGVSTGESGLSAQPLAPLDSFEEPKFIDRMNANEQSDALGDLDREMSSEEFLQNTSFVFALPSTGSDAKTDYIGLWGRGNWNELSGSGDSRWEGSLRSIQLGLDGYLQEDLQSGLIISLSSGEFEDAGEQTSGNYRSRMTSVHPWLVWSATNKLKLWSTLGYGEGGVKLKDVTGWKEDTTLQTVSSGLIGSIWNRNGFTLDLKGEGTYAAVELASGGRPAAEAIELSRMRAVLDGQWLYELSSAGQLTTSVEFGLRSDGGDGTSGDGYEFGVQLGYETARLSMQLSSRTFTVDNQLLEKGYAGSLSFTAQPDGAGLSFSLDAVSGTASSGVDQLWSAEEMSGLAAENGDGVGTDAEIGYGFSYRSGVLTPIGGVSLNAEREDDWYVGGRYQDNRWQLELRREQGEKWNFNGSYNVPWTEFDLNVNSELSPQDRKIELNVELKW